jgi:predicted nucleic acid-binding protein
VSAKSHPDWSRVPHVIVDTSVLTAFFLDEPGVAPLEHLKHKIQLPFASVCELLYIVARKKDRSYSDRCFGLIKSWEVPILHSTEESILAASRLKSQYRLGLGDAFIAATSLCLRLPLLTYDTDYLPLAKEIQLLGIG